MIGKSHKSFPMFFYQFLTVLILLLGVVSAKETSLVVIYGASCSGKSTCASALANDLGADWIVIDRDLLIENAQEPEKAEKVADQLLIESALHHLHNGQNVIIDTQYPEALTEAFPNTLSFFVYAPLKTLIARDEVRSMRLQRNEQRQLYARAYLLDTYAHLIRLGIGLESIDEIASSDLPSNILTYPLSEEAITLYQAIQTSNELLSIYAKEDYHLILRTDLESVPQLVERMKNLIRQRNKTQAFNANIQKNHLHGINLPLSALRTEVDSGIGELLDLLPLIDWCCEVNMNAMQLLPLNDTDRHPSPYNPQSSCALHPIYLSLNSHGYNRMHFSEH